MMRVSTLPHAAKPHRIISTIVLVGLLGGSTLADEKQRAFPGAEGFGAYTPGGRGGAVHLVTTRADYLPGKEDRVPGSLRAAVEASGPRIVIFRVSGTIELKAHLGITEPFITIAGQTASGGGICLKGYALSVGKTHDVVVRYVRCRPGDEMKIELDALSIGGARNVIIDHCSTSWANDEVLSVSGAGSHNVTVQWCMITESLNQSHHKKGAHGYGSLLRTDGDVTFHHNLYAHHNGRNPRPGTYGKPRGILLDFRNNLIYDWGAGAGYTAKDKATMNYVGNYLKPGPSTKNRDVAFSIGGDTTTMFAAGNHLVGGGESNRDNWKMIRGTRPGSKAAKAFAVAPVKTDPAEQAYERILRDVGATLPARDAVDTRIVDQVKNSTGRIINSQNDVGGWPALEQAEPPADTDGDGMPDAWETRHALDPAEAADNTRDADQDGYTNVEECINGTDPRARD